MTPEYHGSHWDAQHTVHPASPSRRRRTLVPTETYDQIMERLGLRRPPFEPSAPSRA